MTMITIHQSFIDESPKLCKNVLHICINQNYEKWFHQIFSHNQVQMISKKLQCSICFRWNFIKFIFLTLATIFWHLLSGPICTLPYLGSSVIQYHLCASALFVSPESMVSNTACLNEKIYWHIWPQKLDKTQKEKKKNPPIRTSIPIGHIGVWNLTWKYVNTQNIWLYLWNVNFHVNAFSH